MRVWMVRSLENMLIDANVSKNVSVIVSFLLLIYSVIQGVAAKLAPNVIDSNNLVITFYD